MIDSNDYAWLKTYPDEISWDADIVARPVYAMLDDTVAACPDRPAFDFLNKKYSWGEIGDLVNKFAKGLQDNGVGKETKVGLFLPNSPYFLVAYYAVLKAGGTVVNYNPLYVERELAHQIEDSETDVMITCDLKLLYDKAHTMLHETRVKKLILCRFTDILPFPKNLLFKLVKSKELAKIHKADDNLWFHDLIENKGDVAVPDIDPVNDLAVLQYTGGTTGTPKGAMLTHQNVSANAEQASNLVNTAPGKPERMVGVLPFFHVFAMTAVMNMAVRLKMEIVALPRFDLDQTLKLIHTKKPHIMPAVPAIFNAMNNHKSLDKYDLSSLQFCISGGAPLPVEVKKSFEDKTGAVVVEGYGLTEAAPVLTCNPPTGENRAGSIGLPFQNTVLEIIDPEDKKTLMKPGERGELCARGPQVMKGYYKKPDETASTLQNGRLYTGDIAIMDDDGYFFIVDRIKDLIITNGYNVYPRNVEEAIYEHPAVEECIVAGIPDKQRGEIVKVWIKRKDDRTLSETDLKEFLSNKLSPMEMPKRIEFRDDPLPKTLIGKLSRKDILAEELGPS